MPLAPGAKVGPYEILAPLGAGGMGEVYRASDGKLKREVAIKLLPDEFARDADRLARFEREAQLLASLNHPNIASIYGLEKFEGGRCLVLELVEGQTLAQRQGGKALPVEEALGIARQIAQAARPPAPPRPPTRSARWSSASCGAADTTRLSWSPASASLTPRRIAPHRRPPWHPNTRRSRARMRTTPRAPSKGPRQAT